MRIETSLYSRRRATWKMAEMWICYGGVLLTLQCILACDHANHRVMMMIAFIIFNSSLIPLIEGLCSSNPWGFESSGYRRNRTDDQGIKSPSLWPYSHVYAHFVHLYCPILLVYACVSQVFFNTRMRVRGGVGSGVFITSPWLPLVAGVRGCVLAGVEIGVLSCIFLYFGGF